MLYETFKSEVLSQLNADVGITVAFSGGSDSVALLHLFWRLQRELGFKVNAVHVEHGIRGQLSLRDAKFAESFCQEFAIPLQIVHLDVPSYQTVNPSISIEEAARLLRFKALRENATKFNSKVIALGRNDTIKYFTWDWYLRVNRHSKNKRSRWVYIFPTSVRFYKK